ncbi:hypothetical protein ACNI3T_00375 [Christiangramia sp. ASW11-125]|uniref:hypothetical protein n=1 Tax=Christiangramia sp. ASW11-125 TaxID=3400701 RepID=UPI003AADF76C
MRTLKFLILVTLTFSFTNCINYESSEKPPELGEAIEINSNQKLLSEINIDEKIEFGYSTKIKKVLSDKTQISILNVTIKTEKESDAIPKDYLEKNSKKIIQALQKEMGSYKNFDKINFRLLSNGEEIQKIIRDI